MEKTLLIPPAPAKKRFSWEWFAAGIVFGAALTSAWFLGAPALPPAATQSVSSGSPQATSTGLVGTPSGAVSVANQPAGDSVTIDSVTVSPPGVWVAVREVKSSDLGNVLGAARVSGPRSGFAVSLLRPTEPGKTYAVELYRDDGNGSFDLDHDSVYVDFDSGQRVVDYFTTTQ